MRFVHNRPVDSGPSENVDSTSAETPDRSGDGGVNIPRPEFAQGSSSNTEVMIKEEETAGSDQDSGNKTEVKDEENETAGLIAPRSEFAPEGSSKGTETMDKGKGKETAKEEDYTTSMDENKGEGVDQRHEMSAAPRSFDGAGDEVTEDYDTNMKDLKGKGKETAQKNKMGMESNAPRNFKGSGEVAEEEDANMNDHSGESADQGSRIGRINAPRSLGGTGEEITEEEAAYAARVQWMIELDENGMEFDRQLSNLSMQSQPTAAEAAKAREGMSKEEFAKNMKIDIADLEKNEQELDKAERERESISEETVAASGIKVDLGFLAMNPELKLQFNSLEDASGTVMVTKSKASLDFFGGLSSYPEILMEVAKYMRPKDLINLYSISKPFNQTISGFLSHTMQLAAQTQAPESASIYRFKFYADLCTIDPRARPHPHRPDTVRMVPSPRWLRMVVHREKTVHDILAMMARQGHRMPSDMGFSLKKMWLLMDISTTRQRIQLFHNPYFTDQDIYNMQMFFIKLDMRFNDPCDGPGSDKFRQLMLGQKGLTPLCKLLKRKIGLNEIEITRMGIRYAYEVAPIYRGLSLLDVPPLEIGVGHLEGWGKGRVHLYRPDELVVREAVRRRLKLRDHIMGMMIWGYVNPHTGENIKVTDEEMYISEEEDSEEEEYEVWNPDWDSKTAKGVPRKKDK